MLDQAIIQSMADSLGARGMGLVLVGAWAEEDNLAIRCFSTVRSSHVLSVAEGVAANVSMMSYNRQLIMEGELVVQPPDESLCQQARWVADEVDFHDPVISATVREQKFAAFAVGDVPMITYLATRIATVIRMPSSSIDVESFTPSPNPGLN